MQKVRFNVLIPWTKESTRFPGKNGLLWHYTRDWLLRELEELPEGMEGRVFLATAKGLEGVPDVLPAGWHRLVLPSEAQVNGHEWTIRAAMEDAGDCGGIWVQLQLTQPVRRHGLLADAVAAVDGGYIPHGSCLSSHVAWFDESWRAGTLGTSKSSGCAQLYDGAIYAWQGEPDWFARRAIIPGLLNYSGPVVDIDFPEQFSPEYIAGVQKLAGIN